MVNYLAATSLVVLLVVFHQSNVATSIPAPYRLCGELDQAWLDGLWEAYKEKYEKSYDATEDETRKQLFVKKVWAFAKHNIEEDLGLRTFRLGFNDFSDWTEEEVQNLYGGLVVPDLRRRLFGGK